MQKPSALLKLSLKADFVIGLISVLGASPTYADNGSRNEFARLVYLYNNNDYATDSSAKLEMLPLFFARSGYVVSNLLRGSGYYADYWSSSVYSGSNAYNLYFYATSVVPTNLDNCNSGRSIRCITR